MNKNLQVPNIDLDDEGYLSGVSDASRPDNSRPHPRPSNGLIGSRRRLAEALSSADSSPPRPTLQVAQSGSGDHDLEESDNEGSELDTAAAEDENPGIPRVSSSLSPKPPCTPPTSRDTYSPRQILVITFIVATFLALTVRTIICTLVFCTEVPYGSTRHEDYWASPHPLSRYQSSSTSSLSSDASARDVSRTTNPRQLLNVYVIRVEMNFSLVLLLFLAIILLFSRQRNNFLNWTAIFGNNNRAGQRGGG
ncbi:hypothetical protein B0T17DRAFT_308125 [Bombardia bombarda]|uniref:Uncharacterized protein n=1 Tax=Bombardia bombarda TaxID=252184 RepID=A0AA40C1W0_9PEZI|nr:hypothetical protein B0T17DRAFT_308125 [Bombardia bombarda]